RCIRRACPTRRTRPSVRPTRRAGHVAASSSRNSQCTTVAPQTRQQVPPDIRPLMCKDAVHDDVARAAVLARAAVADDAVFPGAERLYRPLRPEVQSVRAQADYFAAEPV